MEKASPGPPYDIDFAVDVLLLVVVAVIVVVDVVVNAANRHKILVLDSNTYM